MALLPDKAVVTLQTTVPILSLVAACVMCGKIMADVGHIRELLESQSMTIRNTVNRVDDLSQRMAAVEAYIGLQRSRDGQRRQQ